MDTAESILNSYWGYSTFRPVQKDIINAVLQGKDIVALLPTGGGKSICYQVPAIMLKGVCLVISPLIALMHDQVEKLKGMGVQATAIHSGMHFIDVKRTLNNAINGRYKFIYVSPERLQTNLFKEYLPELDVNLIAVDEAHCISQWGHDFRPDYLQIAEIRHLFKKVPILALTATATEYTKNDIAKQLQLNYPELFVDSFERKNIQYVVTYTENKNLDLVALLSDLKTPSITYCRSRKQTEVLVNYLSQHGINAIAYHAGLSKEKRDEAQSDWMSNKTLHIIATTAFGMGIDKPDVDLVVNFDVPENIESYYQEAGRAGRNGQHANSVIFYNNADINRLQNSIDINYPDEQYLRHIYQCVVEYLQIPISAEPDKYYPFDLKDLCQKFKLEIFKATSAIKLLSQEGLWTATEAVFNQPTLYFDVSRQKLDDVMHLYPDLSYAITNLLRMYGSLFQYPTPIRLSAVAKQLNVKTSDVELLLQRMQSMGIATYTKQAEGPQLYFHHYRVDSRHIYIDKQRIKTLRKRYIERITAILDYLSDRNHCRTVQLLQYFGEHKNEDCYHCDVCASKQNDSQNNLQADIIEYIAQVGETNLMYLLQNMKHASKDEIADVVRKMVDEKILRLKENGIIKLV